MSESRSVPQIALVPRGLAAPLKVEWSCHCCAFQLSAIGDAHLLAAMDDHAAYVIATKDRARDPHFADVRLDALIAP